MWGEVRFEFVCRSLFILLSVVFFFVGGDDGFGLLGLDLCCSKIFSVLGSLF